MSESKVYRIYLEGKNSIEGWHSEPTFQYSSTARRNIEDPDGATARYEITSIPSPFARIDLVKNAFMEVANMRVLDGPTIFHKMVSDALDIGEIFFNIDKLSDKIEIIKWIPDNQLAELEDKAAPDGHRYLADALRKYMKSDAATYNFNLLDSIYILNYLDGPDELNVIGATSPATLFFSNANNLEYVKGIQFGNDKPFDNDYQPLYKRASKYIEYLFALRKSINKFSTLFPAIEAYLELTLKELPDQALRRKINAFNETDIETFSPIPISAQQTSNLVEVLGYKLRKSTSKFKNQESNFRINPTLAMDDSLPPLVLPVESGNRYSELIYTTAPWGPDSAAPYFDDTPINKRTLPLDGSKAPYLTISDFLEDTIIHVPHRLNTQYFYDGGINIDGKDSSYLIPLKPLFFKYFSVKDLQSSELIGVSMLEMEQLAGGAGVRVALRIPIEGNKRVKYVEYTRLYYKDRPADAEQNVGQIRTFYFSGFVAPLLAFNDPKEANYVVTCIPEKKGAVTFSLYQNDKQLELETSKYCRNDGYAVLAGENYQLVGSNFDYVRISNVEQLKGVLIPKFKRQNTTEEYEFTVDLGTSNTHIEFKKRSSIPSNAFTIAPAENILCEMFVLPDFSEDTSVLNADYIPIKVGNGEDFCFPTRTVLSYSENALPNDRLTPLTHANLPLTYDKRREKGYNKYEDNVKWTSDDNYRTMRAYIENLMLLMRNKVLMNDGDLKKTKITWFYPNSMSKGRQSSMADEWDSAFSKYFGQPKTNSMSEAVAPILYRFESLENSKSIVQIDIGGGTTDIAFAKDVSISHTTSFRFAANSIFDNTMAKMDLSNGIIDFYKGRLEGIVSSIKELADIFSDKNKEKRLPSNIASLLFSLKDNKLIKAFQDNRGTRIEESAVDFNAIMRKDENFKIVFVLFYTAIIYHVAKIIKTLDLDLPRHISFSGNGSKLILILTTSTETLADYTKLILERVTGKTYENGQTVTLLGLNRGENPKEVTCKGGFIPPPTSSKTTSENIVLRCSGEGLVEQKECYKDLSAEYIQNALEGVQEFFRFVFEELDRDFQFSDNFNANTAAVAVAKELSMLDLETFIGKGKARCQLESGESSAIGETLFFYPIAGALNAISRGIYERLTENSTGNE